MGEGESAHPLADAFPGALDQVIEINGEVAGRLLVEERTDVIRVVSLDLPDGEQQHDLAVGALRHWLSLADARDIPLTLDVQDEEHTLSLYCALGFRVVGRQSGRVLMRWALR